MGETGVTNKEAKHMVAHGAPSNYKKSAKKKRKRQRHLLGAQN
jgi:hypothetical protein